MNGESLLGQLDISGVRRVIERANSGEFDNNAEALELRLRFIADEAVSQSDHEHLPTNIRQRIAIGGISKVRSIQ